MIDRDPQYICILKIVTLWASTCIFYICTLINSEIVNCFIAYTFWSKLVAMPSLQSAFSLITPCNYFVVSMYVNMDTVYRTTKESITKWSFFTRNMIDAYWDNYHCLFMSLLSWRVLSISTILSYDNLMHVLNLLMQL